MISSRPRVFANIQHIFEKITAIEVINIFLSEIENIKFRSRSIGRAKGKNKSSHFHKLKVPIIEPNIYRVSPI